MKKLFCLITLLWWSVNAQTVRPGGATSGNSSGSSAPSWFGVPFTTPSLASFTWINQSTATATTSAYSGGIALTGVNGSNQYRLLKKAAPSTPYTVEIAFIPNCTVGADSYFALLMRESSSGKLATIQFACQNTSPGIQSAKYTDAATFSAHYVQNNWFQSRQVVWFRMKDDGTNRVTYYSADGEHYYVHTSVLRTDFLTANEIGFATDNGLMTVLSFRTF